MQRPQKSERCRPGSSTRRTVESKNALSKREASSQHGVKEQKRAPLGEFLGLSPGPNGDYPMPPEPIALAKTPHVSWRDLPISPLTGKRPSRLIAEASITSYYDAVTPTTPSQERPRTAPQPPWDRDHHVTFSRNNYSMPRSLREYFPAKPRVAMAKETMHAESFAPLAHAEGRPNLFQAPPSADAARLPRFSREVWRQADPYYEATSGDEDAAGAVEGAVALGPSSAPALIQHPSWRTQKSKPPRHIPRSGTMAHQRHGRVTPWNDRSQQLVSRHNDRLHASQREYFFEAGGSPAFAPPATFNINHKWRALGGM